VDLDPCPSDMAAPKSSKEKLWGEPTPSVNSKSDSGVVKFTRGRSIPRLGKGLIEGEHTSVTRGGGAALEISEVTGGNEEGLIGLESRGARGCETMKRAQ
jgi:hypothetical protein